MTINREIGRDLNNLLLRNCKLFGNLNSHLRELRGVLENLERDTL